MIKHLSRLMLIALPVSLLFVFIGITSAQEPDPTNGDNNPSEGDEIIYSYRIHLPLAGSYSSRNGVVFSALDESYPLREDFDSSEGFSFKRPDKIYIDNGLVHWNISRSGGQQFVYRDIPAFSGDVKLTVRGQVNWWNNNCTVRAGIGDGFDDRGYHDGISVNFGFFGGGCRTNGPIITASGVALEAQERSCNFTGNWLWINGGTPYTAELIISEGSAALSAEGVGVSPANPVYDGVYDTLYVGYNGTGDWPSCSGTIDWMMVEPLGEVNNPPLLSPDSQSLVVDEGQIARMNGIVEDEEGDAFTLRSTKGAYDGEVFGSVVDNGDGTWSWKFPTTDGPDESALVFITATDVKGDSAYTSFDLTVNNVEPIVSVGGDHKVVVGEYFTAYGSFFDPGKDEWKPAVHYDDCKSYRQLPIFNEQNNFKLKMKYPKTGIYEVTVKVTDVIKGDDTDPAGYGSFKVEVISPEDASSNLINKIDNYVDNGVFNNGNDNILKKKINDAMAHLNNNDYEKAEKALDKFYKQVENYQNAGKITEEEARSLFEPVTAIKNAIIIQRPVISKPLRELAGDKFSIGTAVLSGCLYKEFKNGETKGDELYTNTLKKEFNIVTPEYEMKFAHVKPKYEEPYNFDDFEEIVEFAENHDMKVRGHALLWYNSMPKWFIDGEYGELDPRNLIIDYIVTLLDEIPEGKTLPYKDRVFAWDVVNEGFGDEGNIREDKILYPLFGKEGLRQLYIELFKLVNDKDKDGLLFYNDYSMESADWKQVTKFYRVVKFMEELKDNNVTNLGVGFQMHLSLDWNLADSIAFKGKLLTLKLLGIKAHITELDVRIPEPIYAGDMDKDRKKQAEIYEDVLKSCLQASNCEAFVMWGFTDRYSWIPEQDPDPEKTNWPDCVIAGCGYALIFDEVYEEKEAYWKISNLLNQ